MYEDQKYYTDKVLHMPAIAAQTSVIAARTEVSRRTFMENVTVNDFNVTVINGATCTGGINYNVTIGKSVDGTGAFTAIGTAVIGTAANNSVIDAAVTETNFDAGDDVIFAFEAGTALPASDVRVEADVQFRERFVAG